MSISERVSQLIAEGNGSDHTTQKLRDMQEMSHADLEALLRCTVSIETLGINESLQELQQKVLGDKGVIDGDTYIESDGKNVAVAKASLSWRGDNSEPRQVSVTIKKSVDNNDPFELTVEASNNSRFTTEIDVPEAEQLARDGDIGKWDDSLGENLGFFSSREDLKTGIEERIARVAAQLIKQK